MLWVWFAIASAAEPKALDLDDDDADIFTIIGEVQKPEVEVYIRRDNLDKGFVLDLKETFVPRIMEALRRPPF